MASRAIFKDSKADCLVHPKCPIDCYREELSDYLRGLGDGQLPWHRMIHYATDSPPLSSLVSIVTQHPQLFDAIASKQKQTISVEPTANDTLASVDWGDLFADPELELPDSTVFSLEWLTGAVAYNGTLLAYEVPAQEPAVNKMQSISGTRAADSTPRSDLDILIDSLAADPKSIAVLSLMPTKPSATKKTGWAIQVAPSFSPSLGYVPDFPFSLDLFQLQALYYLDRNCSVFVAAHTSAGKTVVAEHAIQRSIGTMSRIIYTSPIKALSNQKFRDLSLRFGHKSVGLLTGDMQVRPDAFLLVMTTEILRSMLLKQSPLLSDVVCVIFDEVHYLNDAERGVVWEEVLILLGAHVQLVLLSATLPNCLELADWLGRLREQQLYVVTTTYRPVPLEHYLFVGKKMFRVVDSRGCYLASGYQGAKSGHDSKPLSVSGIVSFLKKEELLPTILFVFSRRKCELALDSLKSLNLLTNVESAFVERFVSARVLPKLGEDTNLPQVVRVLGSLRRGICTHHSGLLPVLKEAVEMMFSQNLCRVLIATETFAMGVNMPAKSVFFLDTSKPDGGGRFRSLLPGEYVQMAGRAGRRGLDARGVVLIAVGEKFPNEETLKGIITGKLRKLESQFRLTYSTILHFVRRQFSIEICDLMRNSFFENEAQRRLPERFAQLQLEEQKFKREFACPVCLGDIHDYYELVIGIKRYLPQLVELLPRSWRDASLCPGRVMLTWQLRVAVLLTNGTSRRLPVLLLPTASSSTSVLLSSSKLSHLALSEPSISSFGSLGVLSIDEIAVLSDVVVKIPTQLDLRKSDLNVNALVDLGLKVMRSISPSWKPIALPRRLSYEIVLLNQDHEKQLRELDSTHFNCLACPLAHDHFLEFVKEQQTLTKLAELRRSVSEDNLSMFPEYQSRLETLKHLGFVDNQGLVTLKGRVACEIQNSDEILLTELLLSHFFRNLDPEDAIALLSAFVFQERREDEIEQVPGHLKVHAQRMIDEAMRLESVQLEFGLGQDIAHSNLDKLHFGLVAAVNAWARGCSFADITALTEVQEGMIVRTVLRLDEACRDVRNAARIMGDVMLQEKMARASLMIKRDVCFISSLYLGDNN